MEITIEKIEGVTYYTTEYRGTVYTLYFVDCMNAWGLASRRKGLGRMNPGSFRYFDTLADLEKALKAFRGIERLIGLEADMMAVAQA